MQISNLLKQRNGSHNHELCFIGVKFKEIRCHAGFYFLEAVDKRQREEVDRWLFAEV